MKTRKQVEKEAAQKALKNAPTLKPAAPAVPAAVPAVPAAAPAVPAAAPVDPPPTPAPIPPAPVAVDTWHMKTQKLDQYEGGVLPAPVNAGSKKA